MHESINHVLDFEKKSTFWLKIQFWPKIKIILHAISLRNFLYLSLCFHTFAFSMENI